MIKRDEESLKGQKIAKKKKEKSGDKVYRLFSFTRSALPIT